MLSHQLFRFEKSSALFCLNVCLMLQSSVTTSIVATFAPALQVVRKDGIRGRRLWLPMVWPCGKWRLRPRRRWIPNLHRGRPFLPVGPCRKSHGFPQSTTLLDSLPESPGPAATRRATQHCKLAWAMEETRTARFDAATLARFGAVARCLWRIVAESRLDAVARFGAVASERMCEINQQFLFSIARRK